MKRNKIIKLIAATVVVANIASYQVGTGLLKASAVTISETAIQEAIDANTAIETAIANPTSENMTDAETKMALVQITDPDYNVLKAAYDDIKADYDKYTNIDSAISTAEGDKTQGNVDDAKNLIDGLIVNNTKKQGYITTVDALQVEITTEIVEAYEDGTDTYVSAVTSINKVEDVTEKTTLTNRINALKAVVDLEAIVDPVAGDIATANTIISNIETDFADKYAAYSERVNYVEAKINAKIDVTQYESDELETSKDKADISVNKITDVKDVALKTGYLNKINALYNVIELEKNKDKDSILTVIEYVEQLEESEQKTNLNNRISAVRNIIEADEAVTVAENAITKNRENYQAALVLVNALNDGLDKTGLSVRLEVVNQDLLFTEAEAAVVKAETEKTRDAANDAFTLVIELKDGAVKAGLLGRLEVVLSEIETADIKAAEDAIAKVQKEKTQDSIMKAKVAIGKLNPDSDKAKELTASLNKIIEVITTVVTEITDVTDKNANYSFDSLDGKVELPISVIKLIGVESKGSFSLTSENSSLILPFNFAKAETLMDATKLQLTVAASDREIKNDRIKFGKAIELDLLMEKADGSKTAIHQFESKVKVKLSFTADDIKGLDKSKLTVFYVDESGKFTEMPNVIVLGDEIIFETTHFSTFVLGEKVTEEAPTPVTPAPTTNTSKETTTTKTGDNKSMLTFGLLSIGSIFVAGAAFVASRFKREE